MMWHISIVFVYRRLPMSLGAAASFAIRLLQSCDCGPGGRVKFDPQLYKEISLTKPRVKPYEFLYSVYYSCDVHTDFETPPVPPMAMGHAIYSVPPVHLETMLPNAHNQGWWPHLIYTKTLFTDITYLLPQHILSGHELQYTRSWWMTSLLWNILGSPHLTQIAIWWYHSNVRTHLQSHDNKMFSYINHIYLNQLRYLVSCVQRPAPNRIVMLGGKLIYYRFLLIFICQREKKWASDN